MKKELTTTEIEFILGQMKALESEHPKARILFDLERMRVEITYPLPKDMLKVQFEEHLEDYRSNNNDDNFNKIWELVK
jgi:hypothetical protein